MSTAYSLTFINNSENEWSFCCYQEDPDISKQNVKSLAWFAIPVAPTSFVKFEWQIEYQFVWSQMGKLSAGVIFSAGQKWDANLDTKNSVDFTRKTSGAFSFAEQTQFGQPGTLYIHQDGTVPAHAAAVGINMGIKGAPPGAGTGTFVVSAQPNITASFTPHPAYWVTFGDYIPGQVLDMQTVTDKAQVAFPVNVYDMCAVLNADNTWTIATTEALNTAYLSLEAAKRPANALRIDTKLLR